MSTQHRYRIERYADLPSAGFEAPPFVRVDETSVGYRYGADHVWNRTPWRYRVVAIEPDDVRDTEDDGKADVFKVGDIVRRDLGGLKGRVIDFRSHQLRVRWVNGVTSLVSPANVTRLPDDEGEIRWHSGESFAPLEPIEDYGRRAVEKTMRAPVKEGDSVRIKGSKHPTFTVAAVMPRPDPSPGCWLRLVYTLAGEPKIFEDIDARAVELVQPRATHRRKISGYPIVVICRAKLPSTPPQKPEDAVVWRYAYDDDEDINIVTPRAQFDEDFEAL